ncbi:hypothetical protein M3Y99_00475700 [Aphelenchoides fujianensis]|nr:hypothetical protein M3Y99_00475700 [Aphelenchoides fujianensis]
MFFGKLVLFAMVVLGVCSAAVARSNGREVVSGNNKAVYRASRTAMYLRYGLDFPSAAIRPNSPAAAAHSPSTESTTTQSAPVAAKPAEGKERKVYHPSMRSRFFY